MDCMELGFAYIYGWVRDWQTLVVDSADGILTEATSECIEAQQSERSSLLHKQGGWTLGVDFDLGGSRRVLQAMNKHQVTEVAYLPENVLELPIKLRRLYVEILVQDGELEIGQLFG